MYRIGEFSKMSKLTVKTLRYYDEVGLLKPSYVDNENGFRYYTTSQLVRLSKIIALRQIGLSIKEIISIFEDNNIEKILEAKKIELEYGIKNLADQISRINYILSRKKEDFFMKYEAIIKEIPEHIAYYRQGFISDFSKMYDFISKTVEEFQKANPNIKLIQPNYCYVSYLNPEFTNENISLEYTEAVSDFGKETENVKFKKVEKTTAVCVYHRGKYESIGQAFAYGFNWAEENGYKVIGKAREYYIEGIWNQEDSEKWVTEIQIPVEKI